MSDERAGTPYTPAKPSKLTVLEMLEIQKALKDSGLAVWIVLAGVGGLVELIRGIVDVIKVIVTMTKAGG